MVKLLRKMKKEENRCGSELLYNSSKNKGQPCEFYNCGKEKKGANIIFSHGVTHVVSKLDRYVYTSQQIDIYRRQI